jgi:hypothetical protein
MSPPTMVRLPKGLTGAVGGGMVGRGRGEGRGLAGGKGRLNFLRSLSWVFQTPTAA